MPDLSCVICGGTDFYKNAGYFFCSECQTQAANIQEQVYVSAFGDGNDETGLVEKKTAKSRSARSNNSTKSTKVEQLTSWECYNYILLGLVNELIELGANADLKPVVQSLWMTYLKKIEVLHNNPNKAPKLPAYNNKHDAKVIYGRCAKKKVYKRKRSNASITSGSDGSTISRREQNRLRKAMAKAMFESQQTLSTQNSEASLHNQSLDSLKSSNSQTNKESYLSFNTRAKFELSKHMTKEHLKEHIKDVDVALTCHNLTYRDLGKGYGDSTYVTTPVILYAIIYLALLINKDEMQIGDMLRFMNDGSLSYNFYNHFFPEEIDAQISFINTLPVKKLYKPDHIRLTSGKLVALLQLQSHLPTPNIVNLLKRYCKELNLPEEFFAICVNFVIHTEPEMKITATALPNYEGKAMCIIIFVLKLLFGVDGATEIKLSSFATTINHASDKEMFSFVDWLHTIAYRRCILAKYHFPTGYYEKNFSLKDYIDFINMHFVKHDIQRQQDVDYENIERVAFNDDGLNRKMLQFSPSLTPLHDNLKTLYESGKLQEDNAQMEVLLRNFQNSSLQYLKQPGKFLTKDTMIYKRGANDDIKMVPIHRNKRLSTSANKMVSCQLTKQRVTQLTQDDDYDAVIQDYLLKFNEFSKEKRKLLMKKDDDQDEDDRVVLSAQDYPEHFRPDGRYWLNLSSSMHHMTAEQFDEFWMKFPYHFRLIVKECACITMQSLHDLILEYNYFEAYVCYGESFSDMSASKARRFRKGGLADVMNIVMVGQQKW